MPKFTVIFLLTILFLSSCAIKTNYIFSANDKYVTYDKVKIKVNSQKLGKVTLKGYISIVKDSSICFKFWGPLGIEVVSGRLDQRFVLKDHFNDIFHADALQELIDKTGIVFTKRCVENILLAKIDSLKTDLTTLNNNVITLNDNQRWMNRMLSVENIPRKNLMQFSFNIKSQLLNKVSVIYSDENDHWSVEIQVLNISGQQKRCNFDF
ncbi:MAG: hypothetical protein Q8928_01580 [Bacteroidota bacterium]|nr:hypothetical protein [Bacteroidota bacterium]